MDKIALELAPDLSGLAGLADKITNFCEEHSLPFSFQLNLVLEELVGNIIRHGRPEDPKSLKISLEVSLFEKGIQAVLKDNGIPFNPLKHPQPDLKANLEDRPIGGLGIALVRQKVNSIQYTHQKGQNQLCFSMEV